MSVILTLTRKQHEKLWNHLVSVNHDVEELAFLFVEPVTLDGMTRLHCVDIHCCGPDELDHQSAYHIALADDAKAALIKKAHDLGCALVEAHSHVGGSPACFSASDRAGFDAFVPHVLWRLKGKPYAAIVVTATDFDGLAWIGGRGAIRLERIELPDGDVLLPTGRSPESWHAVSGFYE